MIDRKQYEAAMEIVLKYCIEQRQEKKAPLQVHEVGCRVKLSEWGIEMQGASKKKGTVIKYSPWMHFGPTQGSVWVKWDGIKLIDSMDISQVIKIK